MYRVGDRIELVSMPEDPAPVASGSRGFVESVNDLRKTMGNPVVQLGVKWDGGRSLMVVIPPDTIRVLPSYGLVLPNCPKCGRKTTNGDDGFQHIRTDDDGAKIFGRDVGCACGQSWHETYTDRAARARQERAQRGGEGGVVEGLLKIHERLVEKNSQRWQEIDYLLVVLHKAHSTFSPLVQHGELAGEAAERVAEMRAALKRFGALETGASDPKAKETDV